MAGKKFTENTKKTTGNAQKAAAAASKAAAQQAQKEAAEAEKWQQGAKSNTKKETAEARARDTAAKKAERDRLLAEEESSQSLKPKGSKQPQKRPGIDGALAAIQASGIDNALDALTLVSDKPAMTVDRHPERRKHAAYMAYKDRRLPEMKADPDFKGLRMTQMVEIVKKEFEKSPENPMNQQGAVRYDATQEEIKQKQAEAKAQIEKNLAK